MNEIIPYHSIILINRSHRFHSIINRNENLIVQKFEYLLSNDFQIFVEENYSLSMIDHSYSKRSNYIIEIQMLITHLFLYGHDFR